MLLEKLNLSQSSRNLSINTYGKFVIHTSSGVRIWTEHYANVLAERVARGVCTFPNSKKSYQEFLEEQNK